MNYFSMFSGIGGFELGIQRALDNGRFTGTSALDKHGDKPHDNASNGDGRGPDPSCVGYSEVDKYAIKVYERNFSGHRNYGDATAINASRLPDFDLIVGGFPCQSFSIAGKRGGFNDTRGTLFFDIARIIRAKRPRLLVLENVKGLLSHDRGRTFDTIIRTLDELGYDIQWQVLNSKDFGVPQNRERVYIVGHLRGTPRPQVFPIRKSNSNSFKSSNEPEDRVLSNAIDSSYYKGPDGKRTVIQLNGDVHQDYRYYSTDGIAPTLNANRGGGAAKHPYISEKSRIRRLTPMECERLQGFPDDWTAGESDTQRYKMCGNAVTVNVVQAVMERIL